MMPIFFGSVCNIEAIQGKVETKIGLIRRGKKRKTRKMKKIKRKIKKNQEDEE